MTKVLIEADIGTGLPAGSVALRSAARFDCIRISRKIDAPAFPRFTAELAKSPKTVIRVDNLCDSTALHGQSDYSASLDFWSCRMKKTWVVLANASRARILDREPGGGLLEELADLVHPQSREKGTELTSDREGHAQKAHGDPGHAGTEFQPHTDPRQKEHAVFAVEVSRYLEDAVTQGRCPGLVLIASDPFLGELKSHLGDAATRVVSATIPRDLTTFAGPDLARRVTEALDRLRH